MLEIPVQVFGVNDLYDVNFYQSLEVLRRNIKSQSNVKLNIY